MNAIVSCLPYYYNISLADFAQRFQLHYFDLTEDVYTVQAIRELAVDEKIAFIPSCGVAPGFVNIAAHHLMRKFDELDTVKLRVGGLPMMTNNSLQYALTWSTDGLINQYGNLCDAIINRHKIELLPLGNCETVELDGVIYEAFNTSGGVGNLVDNYVGKVNYLNYKTLRYPGHCEKMRFLMNDLKLNEDRPTLKRILESTLPQVNQDVVIIYVAVAGIKQGRFIEETYVKKIYPQTLFNKKWSAMQVATASSASAIIDLTLNNVNRYYSFVNQEQFQLEYIINNRFGKVFANCNDAH